jgi:hypothetical protein
LYAIAPSDEVYNPTTKVLNARYDITWYVYTGSTPQVTTNGFAGNFETKLIGVSFPPFVYPPGSVETIHCVLQGFGSFEGQTLTLSYDGPPHGGALIGFLLEDKLICDFRKKLFPNKYLLLFFFTDEIGKYQTWKEQINLSSI